MRILQVSSAVNFGGGEKHLVDLAAGLAQKGHELTSVVRPSCKWKRQLQNAGVSKFFELPLRGASDVFSAFKLSAISKDQEADIIHAHLARDYPVAAGARRLHSSSAVVLTRHVVFPMSPINRLLLRNVSTVIAVSSGAQRSLEKVFPRDKIVTIPNGIAMEKFVSPDRTAERRSFRSDYEIPSEAPVICTLGELKPLKGQEEFVLAAGEIVRKVPDAFFLIVGTDHSPDRAFRTKLRRLVRVTGLEKQVLFLDWIEDIARLLCACDVFVSASHSEGLPLSILEAMASGIPVTATATEGSSELLTDGESGLIVEIGDVVGIANAAVRLLRDKGLANAISANARKRAEMNFSLDLMVDRTEQVYREAIEEVRSG